MIRHIYVNGIQVDNTKTFIQKINNSAGATVEFSDYQRGGASGQILSKPLYRGMSIGMDWFVKGESLSDFITQRDRLIGYFQNLESEAGYTKTLGIELANGVVKEIDVLFTTIASEISPGDIIHDEFSLTAISEKEHFTSRASKTAVLTLRTLGGMPIPTNIPTTLANNPVGEVTEIQNAGNASAYPIVTITGAFATGCTINNSTNSTQFVYNNDLAITDSLVVDFYNRTAILNGTTNVLSLVSGDWLTLAPGYNSLYISGAEGDTGSATIVYKDTYRNI
jgi:hypothetical protein